MAKPCLQDKVEWIHEHRDAKPERNIGKRKARYEPHMSNGHRAHPTVQIVFQWTLPRRTPMRMPGGHQSRIDSKLIKRSQVHWCHGETRELCWSGFTRNLSNRKVGQSWELLNRILEFVESALERLVPVLEWRMQACNRAMAQMRDLWSKKTLKESVQ